MPNFIIKVKETGAKKADTNVKGLNRSLGSLKSSAMMAAGAFLGAGALIAGIKGAVNAFGEQELAEKKLEASLGKTSQALLNQAAALQQVSVFGDETIIAAQAMIAAFVKDEDQIKLATQATLDLAAAKGMDLVTAADLVSKTLGSSTNAMSRYGIEVKGAVGSSERLASLTENVGKTFGGQALAQSQTMTGSMTQMSNAIGDAAESIGGLLSPAVIGIANTLKFFAEGTQAAIDALTFEQTGMDALVTQMTDVEIKTEEFKTSLDGLSGAELLKLASAINDEVAPSLTVWNEATELVLKKQLALQEVLAGNSDIVEANTGVIEETAIRGVIADDFGTNAVLDNIAKVKLGRITADEAIAISTAKAQTEKDKALKDDLRNAALSGQSASESMKSVVRAKLMESIASAMASVFKNPAIPFPLNMVAAAGVGGALTGLTDKALAKIPSFATGGDFVTSGEQIIRVGDNPSGRERVQVTPLDAGGEPTGGGGSVQINFSGNVMSQDFIENEAIPMIQAAVRRGHSLEGA